MAEGDPALRPDTPSVRPARRHHGRHRRHRCYVWRMTVESHLTGGSTHSVKPTEVDQDVRAAGTRQSLPTT